MRGVGRMQAVLPFDECSRVRDRIADGDAETLLSEHLTRRRTASFEAYATFDLCSFDWYDDLPQPGGPPDLL